MIYKHVYGEASAIDLTKREVFAMAAIQGLAMSGARIDSIAERAVLVADALIEALNKPQKGND